MYKDNFINLLKDKISLTSVIEKKIKVINKGHNKLALCPFHHEKTPSFTINESKGFYHCFGCGAHGDIITFTMNIEHLSFKEAIEKLANENGIPLPKTIQYTKENEEEVKKINNIYFINELTANFFYQNLYKPGGNVCLSYFYKRGVNDNFIKFFKLGFANNSYNDLINFLKENNITEEMMLEAGVVAKGDNGGIYDKFRNRAMIPVYDKRGKIIAFTGRVLNKDTMPKYMNSPESLIYHKGSVLFNYFFARDYIYKNKKAILVEGNFDAITLFVNGIENVVAPMGTAATVEQFLELWKSTEEIIVCFDGDTAGRNASKRVAYLLLPYIDPLKTLKFAFLPTGLDPDDFVRKFGKDKFLEYLNDKNNCLSLSEFLFKNNLLELNIEVENNYITPEQKSKLEVEFQNIIKTIKNPIVAKNFEYYFKGELFKITKFVGKKKIEDYRKTTKINFNSQISFSANSFDALKEELLNIEKNIFCVLILNPKLINELYTKYNVDIFNLEFESDDSIKLINIFFEISEKNLLDDKEYLLKILEKNNFNNYIIKIRNDKILQNFNNVKSLYSLILEKNIISLNIESKELAIKNNNELKRKAVNDELEKLYNEKLLLEEEF